MRGSRFVYALGLLALGGAVSAQSLDATINGAAASPNVSNGVVTVDIGNVTTDTVVHVFDDGTNSTTGPTLPLTGIVLKGTAPTPPATARLKLIVGNQDTETDFQSQPDILMFPGVTDFGTAQDRGSIVFRDAADENDNDALRDITEVAIAVLGEIHADISVGRVYRIQSSTTSGGVGGFISGEITAHAPNGPQKLAPAQPDRGSTTTQNHLPTSGT